MKIMDIPPVVPDGIFWYTLSTVMAGALIAIIWNYAKEMSGMIKELKDTTQKLAINDRVQDERLDGHDEKLYEVKYPKSKRA